MLQCYLLLRGEAECTQFILQVLQFRVELLLLSVEVLEDVVDLAPVTSFADLPSSLLLLEQSKALLIPIRLRVKRVVLSLQSSQRCLAFAVH